MAEVYVMTIPATSHLATVRSRRNGRMRTPASLLSKSLLFVLMMLSAAVIMIGSVVDGTSVDLDCDPCIDRTAYTLKAILHSDDEYWQQSMLSMQQAASDMGVQLILETAVASTDSEQSDNTTTAMTQISADLIARIRSAVTDSSIDALIVTIPTTDVASAIQELYSGDSASQKPIFGLNVVTRISSNDTLSGSTEQKLLLPHLHGSIVTDDDKVGANAANEFIQYFTTVNEIDTFQSAIYVESILEPDTSRLRSSFTQTLQQAGTVSITGRILVNPDNTTDHEQVIDSIFDNGACPYQAVLFNSLSSIPLAIASSKKYNCSSKTQMGVTYSNPVVYEAIKANEMLFGIDKQIYIQSAMSVVLATMFVTTGKPLLSDRSTKSLWSNSEDVPYYYESDPIAINQANLPEQTCEEAAYPICGSDITSSNADVACECIDRSTIRIGGVVHGVQNDVFWDQVFLSSSQAASDLGIILDMPRFEPAENMTVIQDEMSAKIKSFCEASFDGIFVSIPVNRNTDGGYTNSTANLIDSIKKCKEMNVPVISINVGQDISSELNLVHYIGQDEYNAGYEAGNRLIDLGMKYGYCLDHEPGNKALETRCKGFEDSLSNHTPLDVSDIVFIGRLVVPLDNATQYKNDVERYISTTLSVNSDIDWSEIGLLSVGQVQMKSGLRDVIANHPDVIVGIFDTGSDVLNAIEEGIVKFGIDQQSLYQGNLPIYLLTYLAYSKQRLRTFSIESGSRFVTTPPNEAEAICEANLYQVCSSEGDLEDGGNEAAVDDEPEESSSTMASFLPPVLHLDCDPCTNRQEYTLHAVLHGFVETDDLWKQAVAAMQQAATDMKVNLIVETPSGTQPFDMSDKIRSAMNNANVDGLIVTVPDENVEQTIKEMKMEIGKPMFGMNVGYQHAHTLDFQGYIGQNDTLVGELAAKEFLKILQTPNKVTTENSTILQAAVFVESTTKLNVSNQYQREGFFGTLKEVSQNSIQRLDNVRVNPSNGEQHAQQIKDLFLDCPYQAVLLGAEESIKHAVDAKEANKCIETYIGVVDVSTGIYQNLTVDTILFGVDQQIYLQSALTVVTAAVYVTTGKKLSLPLAGTYMSGPRIVAHDTVPSDTMQCNHDEAFPICTVEDSSVDDNKCGCIDRTNVKIAGVLHGHTTDSFWDPVYAAAEQAAIDMDVSLDLQRPEPQDDPEVLFQQMAGRIRSYCENGISGIFVTIPSDTVVDAIKRCLELKVPVISINAGATQSAELGLYHHIAQIEYTAGFGAGNLLIDQGIKLGYCLDHAPGNVVTKERCAGFEDAIKASGGKVEYKGQFTVPEDNKAQYKIDVEKAVGEDGDWEGVGLLSCGLSTFDAIHDVYLAHPKAIVGSFDTSSDLLGAVKEGWMKFGIDQQPFIQGNLPVYLLTYLAYAEQALLNQKIESGPSFVTAQPTEEEKICQDIFFKVCVNEDMNYISSGLIGLGYALFGLLTLMCIVTAVWTYVYRNEWIVKVSQPALLALVVVGCFVSGLSIVFVGTQTGYRTSEDIDFADASCMAVPWLYGLGFVITFSALFAKIQRVKMIYQAGLRMQRKTIGIKDVAYIMAFLFIVELSILIAWQARSPLEWKRDVLEVDSNGNPTESVGGCTYEDSAVFYIISVVFNVLCLFYSLVLCFQTKDINSDFAESNYISLAVAFMFQVLVLAVPISALVRDTSPNVFYLIRVIAIFLQNFTVLSLLFIPKMIRLRSNQDEAATAPTGTRKSASMQRQSFLKSERSNPSGMTNSLVRKRSSFAVEQNSEISSRSFGKFSLDDNKLSLEEHRPPSILKAESTASPETYDTSSPSTTHQVGEKLGEMTKSISGSNNPIESDSSQINSIGSVRTEILSKWEALGFKSEEQAQSIIAVVSLETTPEERQRLLTKL